MFNLICLFIWIGAVSAEWIGEDYWTTIVDGYTTISNGQYNYYGGSESDFVTFTDPESGLVDDGWVALWIYNNREEDVYYEVYGHAYRKEDGRYCAWFVGQRREAVEMCTGFRILSTSRSNPSERNPFTWELAYYAKKWKSVGAHGHFIAKYRMNSGESFYGDAQLLDENKCLRQSFHGVDPLEVHKGIQSVTEAHEFTRRVWILQKY